MGKNRDKEKYNEKKIWGKEDLTTWKIVQSAKNIINDFLKTRSLRHSSKRYLSSFIECLSINGGNLFFMKKKTVFPFIDKRRKHCHIIEWEIYWGKCIFVFI